MTWLHGVVRCGSRKYGGIATHWSFRTVNDDDADADDDADDDDDDDEVYECEAALLTLPCRVCMRPKTLDR
jgi:hypothetical protein